MVKRVIVIHLICNGEICVCRNSWSGCVAWKALELDWKSSRRMAYQRPGGEMISWSFRHPCMPTFISCSYAYCLSVDEVLRGDSYALCQGVSSVQCCSSSYLTPQNKVCPLIWTEYLDHVCPPRQLALSPPLRFSAARNYGPTGRQTLAIGERERRRDPRSQNPKPLRDR